MRRRRSAAWMLVLAALAVLAVAPGASGEAFDSPRAHNLEVPILDGQAAWTGDRVFVLGGRNGSGPQDVIQTFDPATGSTDVLSARLPNDTQAAGSSLAGGQMYLFGGAGLRFTTEEVVIDGEVQNITRVTVDPHDHIVRFNPVTEEVVTLEETLPDDVFGLSSAAVGDATYLFGGVNRTEINGTNEAVNRDWILRFDHETETLERVGNLPVRLRDASAIAHEGSIYLFGGVIQNGTGSEATFEDTNRIYRYDPGTGNVTLLEARMDQAKRWFGLTSVGDRAYLFGGCKDDCQYSQDPEGNDQYITVSRFNFTTASYETIYPEIVWGASTAPMAVHDGTDAWVLGGGRGPDAYNIVYSNVTRFQTGPTPPTTPRALDASASDAGVELTWEEPLYDGGAPLESYVVERSRPGSAFGQVAEVDAGDLSYVDGTAEPGVNHTYRVLATGPGGTSEPSGTDAAEAPTRAPSTPERVQADGLPDSVLVRWAEPASDGGEPIEEYRVYRNGSLEATTGNLSYADGGVEGNVTYSYEVSAVNAEGEGLRAGPVEAATEDQLPPPEDLEVRAGNDSIQLDWAAPSQGSPTGYEVLRGPSHDDLSVLASVGGTGYVDADVERGTPYWYAVAGTDGSGSGLATQAQRSALLAPPGVPGNLAVETRPGQAILRWDAPADTGGAQDVFYNAIRIASDGSETFLNPDFWEETSWVDDEVEEGARYRYAVQAVTDGGTSPRAEHPEVRIPVENTPPNASLSASNLRPLVGENVTFDASGSSDAEGAVVQARFTFDDGNDTGWVSRLDAEHAFTRPGQYEVQVAVKDQHGAVSDPATALVAVLEAEDPATNDTGDRGNDTMEGPGDGTDTDGFGGLPVPGPGVGLATAAALGAGIVHRARRGREGGRKGRGR